jgi:hypothetical protein
MILKNRTNGALLSVTITLCDTPHVTLRVVTLCDTTESDIYPLSPSGWVFVHMALVCHMAHTLRLATPLDTREA